MIEDKERLCKMLYDLSNGVTTSEFTRAIGEPWMAGVRAECRDLADFLNISKRESINKAEDRLHLKIYVANIAYFLQELANHSDLNKSEQATLLGINANMSYILENWSAFKLRKTINDLVEGGD